MWLSKTLALRHTAEQEGTAADMGVTTIGGGSASVMTRGEQRDLEVFAPGGLVWQPKAGDTVLVIKGGSGCQERCVAAADTSAAAPKELSPGELFLYSDGASIYLRKDGSIAITGQLSVEGGLTVEGPVTVEGELTVSGNVDLTGTVNINGPFFINGSPYRPCLC